MLTEWGLDQTRAGVRTVWAGTATPTLGGQMIQDAFAAVDKAAQQLAGKPGVVTQWIDVDGTPVWVRGTTVNGAFRIGTFSGDTLNSKYPLP